MNKRGIHYVRETSNGPKIKAFLITLLILIVLACTLLIFDDQFDNILSKVPVIYDSKNYILAEVEELSPAGLLYAGFFGGLFFVPIPQELLFYYALLKGNAIFLSFVTVNIGFLIAQLANYSLGSRLNKFFFNIISKKKLYSTRRFINHHGGKGVFLFNLLPLPAPLLTFALGIAKYNIYRLFFYMILGTLLKYSIIIGIFIALN